MGSFASRANTNGPAEGGPIYSNSPNARDVPVCSISYYILICWPPFISLILYLSSSVFYQVKLSSTVFWIYFCDFKYLTSVQSVQLSAGRINNLIFHESATNWLTTCFCFYTFIVSFLIIIGCHVNLFVYKVSIWYFLFKSAQMWGFSVFYMHPTLYFCIFEHFHKTNKWIQMQPYCSLQMNSVLFCTSSDCLSLTY